MRLRPLRRRDGRQWRRVRAANADWLAPWDATDPDGPGRVRSFGTMVRDLRRQAAAGRALPFVIESDGAFVGQLTVAAVVWGALRSGQVGYWVDRSHAGRGLATTALALTTDHCLLTWGLHRVEVNIRPENAASLRVVEKLGFRDEGLRHRYLHIDGAWRDHRSFALTAEEVGAGLVHRLRT
ncbi:GNAT family protein [Thalassiella azotivora]